MPRRRTAVPVVRPLAAKAVGCVVDNVTHSSSGLRAFLHFQLSHYRGDERFVPPILAERRDFLDFRVNPFFREARGAYFLVRRQGLVVGRIAAIVDARSNRFHGTSSGTFGLFECENDPGVAAHLFEAAMQWLKREGVTQLMGPLNLAFHHEAGLLVEGFEEIPSMMMSYNKPYYATLFEANGLVGCKDLVSYELHTASGLNQKVLRLAERVERSQTVRVRRIDTRRPENDIRRVKSIYESMLKPGFGFAPVSDDEFDALVNRLRPVIVLRPELSLVAEVNGEAVAFSITVPDTNLAVKAAEGFLFPFGLAKLLWAARKIDRLRVLLFGIRDGFRRRGIDALLAKMTYEQAIRLGYSSAEIGWVDQEDRLLRRTIEATGARRQKTYRIYMKPLELTPPG
jgi:GNAT superfamily N-acetyltransferase